ncbi:nuclear transport factor 2 family protein [Pedobacter antarcticus]
MRIESQFGPDKYADMFTLVKDGNNWKIISKIYHVIK